MILPAAPHAEAPPVDAPPTLLIVDDVPENLSLLADLLRPAYRVRAATSGRRGLEIAMSSPAPDLILLDVMMPGMDGYEVLARLAADDRTRDIPVIFVTALGEVAEEERGLGMGAADYITKPLRPAIVRARVRTQLDLKRARDVLADRNVLLEAEVDRRMAENDLIKDASIFALARVVQTRDWETGNHLIRTSEYVRILGRRLRANPRFADALGDRDIASMAKSAPLHDIGKVGIPDEILMKPGPLSQDEWRVMKTHTTLGSDAIERAEHDARRPLDFLRHAKEIARWHHERWDGSGYPDGLAGDAIPVSARLMALADNFDALISRRTYKVGFSFEESRRIILEGRGTHFDPDVVDAFAAEFEAFVEIARRYREEVTHAPLSRDPDARASA